MLGPRHGRCREERVPAQREGGHSTRSASTSQEGASMPTVTAHNDQPHRDQPNDLPALPDLLGRPLTPVQAEQITMAILDAAWTWDQAIAAGRVVGTVTRGFRLKIGAMLWQTLV